MTDTLFTTYIPLRSRSVESNRRDVRVVSAPIAPPYAMLPPQQQLHIDSNRAQSGQQPGILIHSAPPGPPPAAFDQPQSAEPASAGGRGRRTRTHEIVLKHTCASCGKFRSPSYHHRHPLAPDEDPKPGFCRKCKKVQTSSDESTEGRSRSSDSRRRRKPSKKKKKKERHERSSSAEPNRDDGRSSSREEVIRVVHRSRSAASKNSSRDEQRRRRHSPSSPESPARIRVSYKPSQKKSRAPTEKIQVIDRFRYVDPPAERRSRSRSRSFGISHSRPRERYDEPDDFVHIRRSIESRRPIRFITYRKDRDGNLIEELHQETTELAHGRRLDSTVAQHETRYELSGQERHQHHTISKPRHYYKGSLSSQESFENNAGAYSPPRPRSRSRSRSVRVLRVPYSSEDTNVHSWESESAEIGTPRVTFATDEPIRRRSPSQRRFSEDRLPIRRRRHRARESDDFPVNIHREESLSSGT